MSRPIRTLAIALALTLGVTLAGTSAATADPGDPTIAYGNVTEGNTGAALTNLQVVVYDADPAGGAVEPFAPVTMKADDPSIPGDYQVALPAGRYWFTMSADDHKSITVVEDVSDLSGGYQHLSGQYLDLNTGTLAGSVIADGDPYDCADIEIFDANGTGEDSIYYAYTGELDESGAFSVGLPIGSYRLFVTDACEEGYVSQWVGGASFGQAARFAVTADTTTDVGAVRLTAGVNVTGKVLKGATTTGLDDVDVALASADGREIIDVTATSGGGSYTLPHVGPGTYQLQFSDPLGEYVAATSQVTVGAANVTVPSTRLDAVPATVDTNKLKGKLTGPTKAGIGALYVRVFDRDYEFVATTRTRRDGSYSVNVPAGTYKIQFTSARHDEDTEGEPRDFGSGAPAYRAEWFDNAKTFGRAKAVTVGSSVVTANAELVKNAVISGTIKVPADYDVEDWDLVMLAYDADGSVRAGGYVDEKGKYRIDGLAPGTYTLLADDESYEDDDGNPADVFIRQFFTKKYSLATATAVVAGNGATITGRDVTLSDQLSAISAPKVSGTAKKGKKLTASAGSWTATVDTSYTYQWYRGTSKISGATKNAYTLGSSDVGKQVKVVVTASNDYDNYVPGSSTSSLTKKVVK